MRKIISLALGVTILATAPSLAANRPNPKAEAELAKAIAGRIEGKPVDCIYLRDIRSSRIIDGTAILYETSNRKLYVNRPDSGHSSLRRDDILVTNTHSPQLCSIDIVRLVDSGAWFERGFVGLGKFVPYTKPPKVPVPAS